ncbi:MAG: hypothetical protein Q9163_001070 [Psora crenata]
MSSTTPAHDYGFTAVPRDPSNLLAHVDATKTPPQPVDLDDIPFPRTSLVEKVIGYVKEELREETLNHSLRVFYYGMILHKLYLDHLPLPPETYLLTSFLHDIGTTHTNLRATMMSFEFFGGYLALDKLKEFGGQKEQAESVAEAIIRHQDLGQTGKITTVGAVIQLATILDNIGTRAELLHAGTIEDTIREENGLKPWAHTTALGEREFPEGVEGNQIMKPHD